MFLCKIDRNTDQLMYITCAKLDYFSKVSKNSLFVSSIGKLTNLILSNL